MKFNGDIVLTCFYAYLVTLALVCCSQSSEENKKDDGFEVKIKPDGEVHTHGFQKTFYASVACTFTYSAQGKGNADDEQWLFEWSVSYSKDNTKLIGCSIQAKKGQSHLFFKSFKMEISGVQKLVTGSASGNSGPLSEKEFLVDKEKNYVGDVDGKFGKSVQLTKVEIKGTAIEKSEL